MARRLELTEDDFLEIDEAIASTARGRAYLRERDRRSRAVAAEDIKRYVRSVRDSVLKSASGGGVQARILQQELQEMSAYIQQTRNEIAQLKPDDATSNRIMAATGELDAIVTATERATSDILNATENIQSLVGKLPADDAAVAAVAQDIEAEVIDILTACSFQDITGQRTTKVVNTLRYIEHRVNAMIEIWGTDESRVSKVGFNPFDTRPDAHLLNGPALDGSGVSQDDVDALFGEAAAVLKDDEPPKQTRAAEPARREAPAAPVAAEGSASISQDDIDSLFA